MCQALCDFNESDVDFLRYIRASNQVYADMLSGRGIARRFDMSSVHIFPNQVWVRLGEV
jgi:hypothetical protein